MKHGGSFSTRFILFLPSVCKMMHVGGGGHTPDINMLLVILFGASVHSRCLKGGRGGGGAVRCSGLLLRSQVLLFASLLVDEEHVPSNGNPSSEPRCRPSLSLSLSLSLFKQRCARYRKTTPNPGGGCISVV